MTPAYPTTFVFDNDFPAPFWAVWQYETLVLPGCTAAPCPASLSRGW